MSTQTETVTLSDGATLRVSIERGPTGDAVFHERNTNNPRGGGRIYWRGEHLYLLFNDELLAMQDPRFEFAHGEADAAEKALAFFVQCAESCIQHARAEGIPVEHCYS
ncbi:hypothetical protein LKL35_26345 [Streptomyces sp. ET3-23]|uniref:hypothetical protein n=1 Tax=Streptomyces sp. ET3-23 TaxID=2885643 RepID=UPI001D100716|nr:hypothetical protein [Streptomyces sp. ET3-23]MCC2278921.1 hypothetical protein [Streptomyces sp. ET3-23]